MTKFINQHGITLVACTLALFTIILCCDKCRCSKSETKVSDSTYHVANYKKSILDEEVKFLRDTQRIYIDKWRTKVIKGDSVYVYVKSISPDTCSTYIDQLNKQRLSEQNAAKIVIETDSLIIFAQDSLNKVNEVLIKKYKGDIVTLTDSIAKVRRRGYFKGLKHGLIVGASAVGIINIVK